jgi:hypothetical protein
VAARAPRLSAMNRQTVFRIGAALLLGVALRFVVGLDPVWWLAWFVPGLLFALALGAGDWSSRGYVALAAAIGVTVNLRSFSSSCRWCPRSS